MEKAREIKRRMHSVENTRKITRTMEMVATSKLRRAQQRVQQARPYAERLAEVIRGLVDPELAEVQPLLRQPDAVRRAAITLVTSNRGLCGAFNVNLIRKARELKGRLEAEGSEVELHVVGRKGIGYFRFRGIPMATSRTDLDDRPTLNDARSLIVPLRDRFVERDLDAAYMVYAEFRNMVSTPPAIRRILPVEVGAGKGGPQPYYLLDPSAEEILSRLLPLYVTNAAFRALLETAAAEQAARRTAMKNATDNAEDFLVRLRRTYNRARQAEITQQIAEIMGGAEALAG
ncbi:MAG: ATP synthase F1 subunit gamma [Gemmatimonadota bacterium]